MVDPPIETLSLFVGASSADGRLIVFNGMDETDPSRNGLYVASPNLSDLRLVTPLAEGWLEVDPYGVTPDPSKMSSSSTPVPMASWTMPVTFMSSTPMAAACASSIRPVPGLTSSTCPSSASRQTAARRPSGWGTTRSGWSPSTAARPDRSHLGTGFVWAVSWSPTGEWISYTRFHGQTSVVALVHPDRTIATRSRPTTRQMRRTPPCGRQTGWGGRCDSDATVDGPQDLWIMDLEGTWMSQVTHEPSSYGTYSWAPASGS